MTWLLCCRPVRPVHLTSVCRRGGGGGVHMGSSWRWQLSWAMRVAMRWCRLCCPHRGWRGGRNSGKVVQLWGYSKLLLKSLYYNSLCNSDTLLDCAFEPIYWIVDNLTRWFGVVSSASLFLTVHYLCRHLVTYSPPSGVCLSGHPPDHISRGHRLLVCPTHNPQHLPSTLVHLAPLLRPLASRHGGLPLLQGRHHLPRTPT